MKTALILTTINVPTVLALYRRFDPSVRFFVACDEKTPKAAYDFCASIPDCEAYSPERQKALGWECSPLIGWNTIARRNIALLEALKWGAELIVSVDDDNIPMGAAYFINYFKMFDDKVYFDDPSTPPITWNRAWSGLKVSGRGWFDPGQLQFPADGVDPVCQRGFPQQSLGLQSFEPVVDARIGVAQGAVLGNPDTSAIDRISRHPQVYQVAEILRAGVVSDPKKVWAPLNAQNIAFLRELAPCFLMVPQWKRYDDIYAGLIAQRVMREFDYHVHFGKPFVHQERNKHDLLKDLADEQWGAENILEFSAWLDAFSSSCAPVSSVIALVAAIYERLPIIGFMPQAVHLLGEAWVNDCKRAVV
jgi:hypothetical protein